MSEQEKFDPESKLTRVDEDGQRYYECPWCGGDGHEYQGDIVLGYCYYCNGTGELETNLWDWGTTKK